MRFLADENIALTVVAALRSAGHDVFDVKEARWFAEPDKLLVAHARKERRIILSHDKDFVYQEQVPVILLRFQDQSPRNVQRYLLEFLKSKPARRLRRPLVAVLSEFGVEFHHPYGL